MKSIVATFTGLLAGQRGLGKCLLLSISMILAACSDLPSASDSPRENLDGLVSELRRSPPTNLGRAQDLTGVRLKLAQYRGASRSYEAHDVVVRGLRADYVEYRNPDRRPDRALLIVSIQDVCLDRSQLLSDYQPMQVIEAPSPHSLASEFIHAMTEDWGSWAFGFAQDRPECLRSIYAFVNLR